MKENTIINNCVFCLSMAVFHWFVEFEAEANDVMKLLAVLCKKDLLFFLSFSRFTLNYTNRKWVIKLKGWFMRPRFDPLFRLAGYLWWPVQTRWFSRLSDTYVVSTSTDQTFPARSVMCTVYVFMPVQRKCKHARTWYGIKKTWFVFVCLFSDYFNVCHPLYNTNDTRTCPLA